MILQIMKLIFYGCVRRAFISLNKNITFQKCFFRQINDTNNIKQQHATFVTFCMNAKINHSAHICQIQFRIV